MNEVMISVVTVAQAQLGRLQWTFRSLLGQEIQRIEWIVVYPKGCGEVAQWVERLAYEGLVRVPTEEGDRYPMMRLGAEAAQGRYVLFMEAGNRFYSSSTLRDAMTHLDKGFDICVGSTEYHTRYGLKVVQLLPFERVKRELPFRIESAFIRRELLLGHPFDPRYKWAGDYAFLYGLPDVVICKLRHPVSVVNRQSWWDHPNGVALEREYRTIQGRMRTIGDRLSWGWFRCVRAVGLALRAVLPDYLFPDREDNRDLYR